MFFETIIAGNTLAAWSIACGIAVLAVAVLLLVRRVAVSRVKAFSSRTNTRADDLIAETLAATRVFFIVAVSVGFAATWVTLGAAWGGRLRTAIVICVFAQIGLWGTAAARFLLEQYRLDKLESDRGAATMVGALQFVVVLVLWSLISLLALDNLGVDVTALVAGLGVGGIAIALAVQNILGDLFASLAIIMDRPFVVGDFINVDDKVGTVEHIGLKTTRVRSISGEQIIFANADMLSNQVRNFGRMQERRIVFTLGVTYETPRASLERIPGLIRDAIDSDPTVRFDRSHFSSYGDFSINFETVYFVKSPAYPEYMDAQQGIYLRIHEAFETEDIQFAYPTQTLVLTRP
jgi:small-conductance mechanosensitive channel